ncbi:right-handed parallel beta-helix repeat-containing protein [Algibacter sp. L1A34]|uniref:right-handed parallel beta-helix repeat-containing protein n=1 Tax=Algibacter sp. L1A34 TaxID=2686365 RepID=UPI001E3C5DA2|nr:right-handed parallel beta-helix repeat-containing protein [Algibacter sp. L1A34]
MKKLKNLMLVTLIGMSVLGTLSCNNEELYEEPVAIVEDESNEDEGLNVANVDEPCDFNLDDIDQNSTVIINCVLDLQGETFNLPENVTLIEEGGEIINGTLNFSEGSSIDGDLLGNTLTVTGTKPSLRNAAFTFDPKRWGIVEGVVSDEVALNNRNILQSTIDLVKEYGIDIFVINEMDAYFHLDYGWKDAKGYNDIAIHLPSDFHLEMTDDTHLRLQPNHWPKGVFVSIYERDNVVITGGNIHGDRYTHDYSDIIDEVGISRSTHEWPGLITVAGSANVTVDGLNIVDSTGDAFIFGSTNGFRYSLSNKRFNQNIVLKNSILSDSRRNNITISDGEYLTIDNCIIKNAGQGENIYDSKGSKIISSAGVAPRVGIDIEAFRGYAANGDSIDFEKAENITITGCSFENNNVASIIDYSGKNVVMQNNISDNGFFASYSTNAEFLNNTFVASKENRLSAAITTGNWIISKNGIPTQLSENNKVEGNSIKGFRVGVITFGKNGIVSRNIISDYEYGIQIKETEDFHFEDNSITDGREVWSIGIAIANVKIKNLYFKKQTIISERKPIELYNVDNVGTLIFTECSFESKQKYNSYIKNTPNVEVSKSNLIRTGFTLDSALDFKDIDNNRIN